MVRCDDNTTLNTDSTHKPVTCQKSRAIAVVRVVAAVAGVPEHAGALPEVGLRVVKAKGVCGKGVQPPREAPGHTRVRPSWKARVGADLEENIVVIGCLGGCCILTTHIFAKVFRCGRYSSVAEIPPMASLSLPVPVQLRVHHRVHLVLHLSSG